MESNSPDSHSTTGNNQDVLRTSRSWSDWGWPWKKPQEPDKGNVATTRTQSTSMDKPLQYHQSEQTETTARWRKTSWTSPPSDATEVADLEPTERQRAHSVNGVRVPYMVRDIWTGWSSM